MSGKIIPKVLLVLLLAAITLAFPSIVHSVEAINVGSITINTDGTISPLNAPITRNGDVYTFTNDIEKPTEGTTIVIQKSDIVLDGAGHILNGTIPPDYGYIDIGNWGILNAKSNVTIKNFIITNFTNTGISISGAPNCTIRNNTVYYCNPPIGVWETTNCTIIRNYVKPNGIWLGEDANNNTIMENTCVGQIVRTYTNYGNQIYHNNFLRINESTPIPIYCVASQNTWDNGYPSGGNFWDGYNGVDSNGDGLGDTPFYIAENNIDRYPLMKPYPNSVVPEFSPSVLFSLLVVITVFGLLLFRRNVKAKILNIFNL